MTSKVFITGGAQRIGKALVEHFHSIGWDVLFQYRSSKSEAENIRESLNNLRPGSCEIIECDFDDKKSCENFYEELEQRITRSGDSAQQAGSERVTARCTELLRQLEPTMVKERLEQLLAAALDNRGDDVAFLEKWGYDAEQKQAIGNNIYAVADG